MSHDESLSATYPQRLRERFERIAAKAAARSLGRCFCFVCGRTYRRGHGRDCGCIWVKVSE